MSSNPQKISVLGAGIMGIISAYILQTHLPRAEVTLYDPNGFPADNASFAAGGMIAPLSELDHMPHHYLPAGFDAINKWQTISAALAAPFEFSAKGSILLTHDADRHLLERFKSLLPANSNDWEQINAQKITALEPALNASAFRQALHMKREAHLHPQKAMHALLKEINNKKAEAQSPAEASQSADWVIDCRGIAAQNDTENLRGVKGEILITHNPEFTLSRPLRLMHPRYPLYIVPREGKIFMIGATIIESNEGKNVTIRSGMELMSALYSIDRSFGDADILELKSGIRPSYPDNLPQIHINKNIIRANGLYRHGFLFSPIMAQTIAHYISGETYKHANLFITEDNNENNIERNAAIA